MDKTKPLLILNSDQVVDMPLQTFLDDAEKRNLDGSILTFIDEKRDPKWSFAAIDKDGFVTETKEKVAISEYATVGVYLFKTAEEYIENAVQMVVENERSNKEFYVAPVYNYLIKGKKKVGIYNIDFENMHGIGTPEDLAAYLDLKKCA